MTTLKANVATQCNEIHQYASLIRANASSRLDSMRAADSPCQGNGRETECCRQVLAAAPTHIMHEPLSSISRHQPWRRCGL